MNKKTIYEGGENYTLNDFMFEANAVREALKGIVMAFKGTNNNFKMWGCTITATDMGDGNTEYSTTEGFIFLQNEVFYVPQQTVIGASSYQCYFQPEITYAQGSLKTFENGIQHQTREIRRGKLTVSPVLPIEYVGIESPAITENMFANIGLIKDKWHYIGDSGEPVFLNGWSNENSINKLRFKKDIQGRVLISGVIKPPSTSDLYVVIRLSSNYRPTKSKRFYIVAEGGQNSPVEAFIQTNGDLYIYHSALWSFYTIDYAYDLD